MQRLDFRAMGCQMLALIDSTETDASEAVLQVPGWFEEWEQSLSRFRNNSELNALNRADGNPMRVSQTLWQVLGSAIIAARESENLVTPTLLDAVKTAGYTTSFGLLASDDSDGITASAPVIDWRTIERDEKTRTVRLPRGMHLDFGGIAKGWAADQAAQRLSAVAPVMIDAGGDIALSNRRNNGEPWGIGMANPFEPESDLEILLIERGGVATSGRDYRCWQHNGRWQHHIIDPRTGTPADTDVLTATVVAPTTRQAEVAAKVALILGSRAGLEWLEARKSLAGLLVLDDGRILKSSRMENYLWHETLPAVEAWKIQWS